MFGYIDYENLNEELQQRVDRLTPIRLTEEEFVGIQVPYSGFFIISPSEGFDYLPTRDSYSILSTVDEIGDNYVRTSLAGRITLEDVEFNTSLFLAHRIFPKVNGQILSIAQERSRALVRTMELTEDGLPIHPDIPYNTWIPLNNEYTVIDDVRDEELKGDKYVLSAKAGLELMKAFEALGELNENGEYVPKEINIGDITNLQNILDNKVNLQWEEF